MCKERQLLMEERKQSKLQHVLRTSWDSEQMPGWEDSLSMILEAIKKEVQMKSKVAEQKNMQTKSLERDIPAMEEEVSLVTR